jgi:hypothetical protein
MSWPRVNRIDRVLLSTRNNCSAGSSSERFEKVKRVRIGAVLGWMAEWKF